MREKIKKIIPRKLINYYDEYLKLTKEISPSVFASSLVYYFIIVSIPLITYLFYIISKLGLIEYNYQNNLSGISLIIFIFNLVYVSSKIVHNLKIVSTLIYQKDPKYTLIERIKSIILMIYLFFLTVILIVGELYLQFIFEKNNFNIFIINSLIILFRFIMICFIYSYLLKKIIPVKIKLINTFKLSLIVTLVSYILIIVYKMFYQLFEPITYQNLYGNLYQLFLLIILVYFLCLVLIYSIIFEFIMYKIKNIEYNNSEHERGV